MALDQRANRIARRRKLVTPGSQFSADWGWKLTLTSDPPDAHTLGKTPLSGDRPHLRTHLCQLASPIRRKSIDVHKSFNNKD